MNEWIELHGRVLTAIGCRPKSYGCRVGAELVAFRSISARFKIHEILLVILEAISKESCLFRESADE